MSGEPNTLTRILVVDDSRLILKAAQKILGTEFEVITAADGDDAWEQLEKDTAIQVVFTDLDMPNCDGYELLQKVRTAAEPGLQNMPVIVVTGADNDESARLKSLHLGATDFITKPFTSTDLIARARAHAKYQRITKQLQAQTTLDSLTGLANKPGFLDRLQQDIAYARRHQQALTLMRVEIDDLRAIFLKRGKDVAEQLMIHVSTLLRARIRKEDTAGRIGLGGFAISLPGGQKEGIEGMVDRLHAEVAAHAPVINGEPLPITLTAAVLSAELQHWPSAQEALDRCQALLDSARQRHTMPSVPQSQEAALAQDATATQEPALTQDAIAIQEFALTQDAATAQEPASTQEVPVPAPPQETVTPQEVLVLQPLPEVPVPEPLRLDPLLDQVQQGQTQEAIDKMPQVMQRLAPLLRLLSANQRAQLIGFLEKLRDE